MTPYKAAYVKEFPLCLISPSPSSDWQTYSLVSPSPSRLYAIMSPNNPHLPFDVQESILLSRRRPRLQVIPRQARKLCTCSSCLALYRPAVDAYQTQNRTSSDPTKQHSEVLRYVITVSPPVKTHQEAR